jgi:hypothetical protein
METAMEKKEKKAESPEKNEEVQAAYKVPFFERIPFAVKALFFKYWFMGADYFFFVMGISMFAGDSYNLYLQILLLGIAMGFFNDFLLYNLYSAMESGYHESFWYEIYKSKKWISLLINVLYGLVWAFLTSISCAGLVKVIPSNDFGAFREPLTFAVMGLAIDFGFIFIKDAVAFVLKKRRGEEIHL